MKTIVIPQFYRGPSGQKGLYNRQEVGLARAFAALGCRAVVLYPEPGAKAPRIETPPCLTISGSSNVNSSMPGMTMP